MPRFRPKWIIAPRRISLSPRSLFGEVRHRKRTGTHHRSSFRSPGNPVRNDRNYSRHLGLSIHQFDPIWAQFGDLEYGYWLVPGRPVLRASMRQARCLPRQRSKQSRACPVCSWPLPNGSLRNPRNLQRSCDREKAIKQSEQYSRSAIKAVARRAAPHSHPSRALPMTSCPPEAVEVVLGLCYVARYHALMF